MNNWWLGHIIGVSSLIFSFLDIVSTKDIFNSMPLPFRYSIEFLSLVYILFQSLRAYERWRADRYANENSRLDLIERKAKMKIQHKK